MKFIFVWGNGKVDGRGIDPERAQKLQHFVDTTRKTKGGPCVITVDFDDIYTLFEQTAEYITTPERDVMRQTTWIERE